MEIIIIILLIIAIGLFLLSFITKKDRVKELQDEVESLSLTVMQDSYQLKKKIKILEEELLFSDDQDLLEDRPAPNKHDMIMDLYQKGQSTKEISEQISLPFQVVENVIQDARKRGF